ncbi:Transcriptional regulatory protein FixJ [Rubripirellula lacrimiformis]|uniref:Transcriptional regulatory protein FixJ n=1 Tax=Rubripirellula lacrimiformis TaxID=1930273 RepID=A0A517NDR5_9BACT|nr:response regulator [Rubripirellula lacrimiformis]QDT05271.1 Transcriptional regulatory protein FixJ [Rubripirellula lacrimiformis]
MSDPIVFVIDDDADSRRVVVELIATMSLPVQDYDSAEAFLSDYKGQRPACIVTDQRMPGMSGIDLIERLQQEDLTIPVVVVTAFPDTQSTVRAVRGGAISLIEKPCSHDKLWAGILEAIRLDNRNSVKDAEREHAKKKIDSLNDHEREVVRLLIEGLANKVIASRLEVSLRTVESRRAKILSKFEVTSIAGMVKIWLTGQPD